MDDYPVCLANRTYPSIVQLVNVEKSYLSPVLEPALIQQYAAQPHSKRSCSQDLGLTPTTYTRVMPVKTGNQA